MQNYKGTETFQLLVKGHEARSIVEEWTERCIEADLRLRRAKTRGHVVVETRDVMFAAYIQRHYPACLVNIKQ